MICPSCGDKLVGASAVGADDSWRCESCGGLWLAPWVVNRVADGNDLAIRPAKKEKLFGGKNVCPLDKETILSRPRDVVADVNCWLCEKCGWWWFAGDDVFKFAEAYRLKKKYAQVGKPGQKWALVALPALASLIMVIGLIEGVGLVQRRQQAETEAASGLRWITTTNLGQGEEQIVFAVDQPVSQIGFRKLGETTWHPEVVHLEGDLYVVRIGSLNLGVYEVEILGKIYQFKVE